MERKVAGVHREKAYPWVVHYPPLFLTFTPTISQHQMMPGILPCAADLCKAAQAKTFKEVEQILNRSLSTLSNYYEENHL